MESEDAIDTQVLKAFEFENDPHVEVSSSLVTEEFTSLYPESGLPDHGRLTINYVPGSAIIEMKSLKYYITSFRSVGIRGERAAQIICRDLGKLVEPVSLEIELEFNTRGGITNTVDANYVNEPEVV